MVDITEIMDMLDWHMPPEIQCKGIVLAQTIDSITPFIQPVTLKHNINVWENCATIISKRSDEELEPYLLELLEWIEDLNWPGALIILKRLKIFSGEKLKEPFMNRYTCAENLNNEEGLRLLDCLSELLDNEELKARLPKLITEKLQKHYKNPCFWYKG